MISSRMFRTTLYIVLLCMFVPALVVGLTSTALTRAEGSASFHRERTQQLDMLKNTCDITLDESNFIYLQLLEDERAKLALDYEGLALPIPYSQLQNIQAFQHNLQLIAESRPFLNSIVVYCDNPYGLVISSLSGLVRLDTDPDMGWYDIYLSNADKQQYAQSRLTRYNTKMLTVFISLNNSFRNRTGAMIFNYNQSDFENLLPDDGTDWIVLGENGTVLFESINSDNKAELYSRILELDDETSAVTLGSHVLYQVRSQKYGWRYLNIVDNALLYAAAAYIPRLILIAAALSLGAGVIIAVILSRLAAKPIVRITDMIRRMYENGEPPEELEGMNSKADEYEIITYNILSNHLSRERLNEELAQRRLRLREAEMLALQAQIKPHFLYNTMEIINWKAIYAMGETNEISSIVTKLSELLRYVLEDPSELVPLRREIEHGRCYADLMKYRLGPIFSVKWDVSPDAMEIWVPKLILQPLIENAIQHGIQQSDGSGVITVDAVIEDDHMRVCVSDNGVGMPPELLESLRAQLLAFDGLKYAHIGVFNVYQRARLIKDAQMTIDSIQGEGTRVSLVFPIGSAERNSSVIGK